VKSLYRLAVGMTVAAMLLIGLPVLTTAHDENEGQGFGRGQEVSAAAKQKGNNDGDSSANNSESGGNGSAGVQNASMNRGRGANQQAVGSNGKQRSCEAHERNITRRSDRLVRMATNMLEVFARIAQRVQTFYTAVLVPGGHTLDNYDALLADIANQQTAVEGALVAAGTTADAFSCDAENPKESLHQFRQDMQAVKRALKDYRRSVRNLIVAVRSQAKQMEVDATPSPGASPSPTPEASPSPSPS
jgi:hypothetical protein